MKAASSSITFCTLLIALLFSAGCARRFDCLPLSAIDGWSRNYSSEKLPQAIVDDCRDYIQKLSPKERKYIGSTQWFVNGSSYAVVIDTHVTDAIRTHVLIYDRNKRAKVLKYVSGYS